MSAYNKNFVKLDRTNAGEHCNYSRQGISTMHRTVVTSLMFVFTVSCQQHFQPLTHSATCHAVILKVGK